MNLFMKIKILFVNETFGLIRKGHIFFHNEKNLLAFILVPIIYPLFLTLDLFVLPLILLHSIKIRKKDKIDYRLEELGIKRNWYLRSE